MTWTAGAGLVILVLTLIALFKGYEVRLILFLAALTLAGLTLQFDKIIVTFFQGLADATSIVPICGAMGFAFVLKAFECDKHLVEALSRPLLYAKWLVVPGTILIGFLVNITIISQTSTSLAVGTVLIPLLRSLGLKGAIIGAALLLGASIGGELLNPGAPELGSIATRLEIKSITLPAYIRDVIFFHLAVAMLVFLWMNRSELRQTEQASKAEKVKIHWFSAIVPIVPIVLLFLFGPPLNIFTLPDHWLIAPKEPPGVFSPRLIGLAMLCGCVVACVAVPKKAGSVARHFFEGAGYGYTHIISLIVIAKCFSEGIKLSGIADVIGHLAEYLPILLLPLATLLPALLAFLSGSGIGATQGLYPLLADVAIKQGVDPIHVGVLACIGAAAGRTMSLVAAVTLMCSQMTESKPAELSKRVALPLCVGLLVLIAIMMIRHLIK
ncbi:MAG TPA: C4-dicarboxylate transporter DcuC [Gemmatales bacterium]|nr:C4-dicarboxylate transporter DcuC [Gemmatales bacterium]